MWCECGHELDVHADTFMQPCTVDGCDCFCYDEIDEDWRSDE